MVENGLSMVPSPSSDPSKDTYHGPVYVSSFIGPHPTPSAPIPIDVEFSANV